MVRPSQQQAIRRMAPGSLSGQTWAATPVAKRKPALEKLRIHDRYLETLLADVPDILWRLDETSGTIAVDASQHGRNGTYTGSYTQASTVLPVDHLPSVSLSGGYVTRTDTDAALRCDANTGIKSKLSLEISIEPAAVNLATQMVVTKHTIWNLRIENDGSLLWFTAINGLSAVMQVQTAPGVLSPGVKHHIIAVYDRVAPFIGIYIDGALSASDTTASGTPSDAGGYPIQVGHRADSGVSNYGGPIGWFAGTLGKCFDATTVLTHYNAWANI